jgi:hypothetical protein
MEPEELKKLLEEMKRDSELEETHHLALHATRNNQEAFFEKYKDTDPENYRMFREARELHHEELLRIRRRRQEILNILVINKPEKCPVCSADKSDSKQPKQNE